MVDRCYTCDKVMHSEDYDSGVRGPHGESYCSNCVNDGTVDQCAFCGHYFETIELDRDPDNDLICGRCIDEQDLEDEEIARREEEY